MTGITGKGGTVCAAVPSLDQPMSTWVAATAAVLSQHPPAAGASRTANRLTCAGNANRAARTVAGLPPSSAAGARPRLSTVHQVKGDQDEAVLLLIPTGSVTDRTLTAWLNGAVPGPDIAEALRVAYVGVTRARRLLGLAIPSSDQERVLASLHRYGILTEPR